MKEDLSYVLKSRELIKQGLFGEAIQMLLKAVESAPHNDAYWSEFAHAFRFVEFNHYDGKLKYAIAKCLERVIGNHQDLSFAACSLLKLSPVWYSFLTDYNQGILNPLHPLLSDPLLLDLLHKVILTDPLIENILIFIRQQLYRKYLDGSLQEHYDKIEPFLYALASQNWLNEYVHKVTEEEREGIDHLCSILPWENVIEDVSFRIGLLIIACYIPIYSLTNVQQLSLDNGKFELFKKLHVTDPLLEKEYANKIDSMGEISDEVSIKVQQQYENNPYPRWSNVYREEKSSVLKKLEFSLHRSICIAGCGTGQQAINAALEYPQASILALDLSRRSLSYALRKSEEYEIKNVKFFQADILELSKYEFEFDLIECTGVLHHMKNPYEGCKILAAQLKPGGLMLIGLYSALSRSDVIAARVFIKTHGFKPTLEGIRKCRETIFNLPEENAIKKVSRSLDFYSFSGCRDLLFHVQEHVFTLIQIKSMLSSLGLVFLGFDLRNEALNQKYRQLYPCDFEGRDLLNWHEFEQRNPDMFAGMYQFWIQKPV